MPNALEQFQRMDDLSEQGKAFFFLINFMMDEVVVLEKIDLFNSDKLSYFFSLQHLGLFIRKWRTIKPFLVYLPPRLTLVANALLASILRAINNDAS